MTAAGLDLASGQTRSNPADFLHRPADQWRLLRIIGRLLFGGAGMLALRRMAASMAKASMTSETCRCQPCQACPGDSRGTGLVVVETEFVFGRLEAVLNGPALSFHSDQHRNRRAGGAPGGEEGQLAISNVAADQKALVRRPARSTDRPGSCGPQLQCSPIDAPLIRPLPIIREKVRTPRQKCNSSARASRAKSRASSTLEILANEPIVFITDLPLVQYIAIQVFAVRPEGAYHQWRKDPSRELSITLVADERFGRAT